MGNVFVSESAITSLRKINDHFILVGTITGQLFIINIQT